MKKISEHIICLFMLCIVLIATAIPTYAAGAIDVDKDTTLTISYQNEGTAISGARFDIYRVADVDAYAQMTLTERFVDYPITLEDKDQTGWDTLATTLKGYVWKDSLSADYSGETSSGGSLSFELKPGLYLVIGSRRTIGDYTYSALPYLVFLPGSNVEENTWDYEVTSYPKTNAEKNPDDDPDDTLITRKVLKIWDDSGKESSRPKEITVHLMSDGKVVDTVVLNASNNWRYAWDNLERNHDWLVTEDSVSNYTQTISQEGITFTVKNTVKPSTPSDSDTPKNTNNNTNNTQTLPLTGMLWWPVPVLLIGGLLCIMVGMIRRKGITRE